MPRLLILSIDGLGPSAYQATAAGASVSGLCQLAQRGAWARQMRPVDPTLTMANHVTLATGVLPARHGIDGNTRFWPDQIDEWQDGESKAWVREADAIRAPTLWEAVERGGGTSCLVSWPVTLGARAQLVLPEVFTVLPSDRRTKLDLLRSGMTPTHFQEAIEFVGERENRDRLAWDEAITQISLRWWKQYRPTLSLVHLSAYDHYAHNFGVHSTEAASALRKMDEMATRLTDAVLGEKDATIFILGDHGFLDFNARVHPNAILAEAGLIEGREGRVKTWRALAHTNCSIAPVYLKRPDPSLAQAVLEALEAHAPGHYHVHSAETLRELGCFPGAIGMVEALPGLSLGQRLEPPWFEPIPRVRGEHGYSSALPEMQAGFIAAGCGVAAGYGLGSIRLLDIAPTAARLLGVPLPDTEGRAIDLSPAQRVASADCRN